MKLEDMVCSLEMSRRLIDAGIRIRSYFRYFETKEGAKLLARNYHMEKHCIPAPLFAELSELLPDDVFFSRDKDEWIAEAPSYQSRIDDVIIKDTPANAAASMLIWLKEKCFYPKEEEE